MSKLSASTIFSKSKDKSKVAYVGGVKGSEDELYSHIVGYARKNSLETIVEEITTGRLSTEESISPFGNSLEEFMVYTFKGDSLSGYNLNDGDTFIYVPREHYSRAIPGRIIELTTPDDVLFVRFTNVTCSDNDYIIIPKETIKDKNFAALASTLTCNGREQIAPGLLVTKIERPLASIYERTLLFYDEGYAKKGLLIQAIHNMDRTITFKTIEPGNGKRNLKAKEITVPYDAWENNYLVSAERIIKAVSNGYSK